MPRLPHSADQRRPTVLAVGASCAPRFLPPPPLVSGSYPSPSVAHDEPLESEVRVLIDSPATKLLSAARRLNRRLAFVVDGYNECAEEDRAALTRRVAALVRMYDAGVLVTSQIALTRGDRLQLHTVDVPAPDMDTKEAIALTWTGGAPLPEQLRPLLEAVGSGLEARLVGEVGEEMRPDGSRYALFDAFTRKRLGDSAAEGIRLLSHLAGCLADRVAFSLPELEFNRLTERHGVSQEVALCVQRVGLLAARGHRVSFAHEMYFDAFAAENVVRRADDVAAPVLATAKTAIASWRMTLSVGGKAVGTRTMLPLEEVRSRPRRRSSSAGLAVGTKRVPAPSSPQPRSPAAGRPRTRSGRAWRRCRCGGRA